MAKNLKLQILGVKEAFDNVKKNFNKISNEIDMEVGDGVQKIILQAKTSVPANYSRLATSLYFQKVKKYYSL